MENLADSMGKKHISQCMKAEDFIDSKDI